MLFHLFLEQTVPLIYDIKLQFRASLTLSSVLEGAESLVLLRSILISRLPNISESS